MIIFTFQHLPAKRYVFVVVLLQWNSLWLLPLLVECFVFFFESFMFSTRYTIKIIHCSKVVIFFTCSIIMYKKRQEILTMKISIHF